VTRGLIGAFTLLTLLSIWLLWDCLVFRLYGVPNDLRRAIDVHRDHEVVLLFGNPCTACESSLVFERLAGQPILIVFETGTTDHEVRNFMEAFEALGIPMVDDGSIEDYLKRMARCEERLDWRQSYILEIDEDRRIVGARAF